MPYLVLALLATSALAAALVVYLARLRPAPGRGPLMLLLAAVAVWSAGYALELHSTGLAAKLFWDRIQYTGVVAVAPAWFAFALAYTGKWRKPVRREAVLLALVPAITLLLVWTNRFHGLLWAQVELNQLGPLPLLDLTYGPWFWIHAASAYLLLAGGVVFVGSVLWQASGVCRGQAAAVLLGILPVWVLNALYLAGAGPLPNLDLTPLAFGLTAGIYAWSLLNLNLLTLTPIARRVVVEGLRDGVLVLDLDHRIVDVNPAAERALGVRAAELNGRPLLAAIGPTAQAVYDYEEDTWSPRELTLAGGQIYELQVSPLTSAGHQPIGKLVVLHDITERKRSEAALRESEALHRRAAEAAGAVPYYIDYATESYRFIGAGIANLTGYTPDEMTPARLTNLQEENIVLDRERSISKAEAVRSARSGTLAIWRMDSRIRTRTGELRWIADSAVQVLDEQGQIVGAIGILQDITGRKQAEERLRQNQWMLVQAERLAHIGSWQYNLQRSTMQWSDELYRIYGLEPQASPVGMDTITQSVHPEDQGKLRNALGLLKQQQEAEVEMRVLHRDGTVRDTLTRVSWVRSADDSRLQVIGITQDITERKRGELRLHRQNEYLAALHKISLDLLQLRDLDNLLQAIVDSAAGVLNAPHGELMLREGEDLVVRAVTAYLGGFKGERVSRAEARLSWQAYDTQQPAIVDDYAVWAGRRAVYDPTGLHAVADFPIVVHGHCVGVLALGRTEPNATFDPDDVQKGILYSQLAALALDNAQSHAAIQREIAERRQAEEALRASEAKYRSLVESTDAMIGLLDRAGRILYVNEVAARQFGTPPEALVGKALSDLGLPSIICRLEGQIRQVIESNRGLVSEAPSDPAAPEQWYRISIQPVSDSLGQPVAALLNILDITSRIQSERALQRRLEMEQLVGSISTWFIRLPSDQADAELQHTLARLGEFAGVDRCYIFRLDEGGETISNSHEWCAPGITAHIAEGQKVEVGQAAWIMDKILRNEVAYIPRPADLPASASRLRRVVEAQSIQSLLCVPMVSEHGPLGFMGFDSVRQERQWTDEDVALLRLAGEAIANAFERWRADAAIRDLNRSLEQRVAERTAETRRQANAMDATDEGMAILQQGRFVYVNPAYAALHGYSRDELVGQAWEPLYVLGDSRVLVEKIVPLLQAHGRWTGIVTGRRKDGTTLEVEVSLTLTDHELIVSERDVTQRITAERALRQAEARYRNLFEQAPVMYVTTELVNGVPYIASCNDELLTTLGYTREELIGAWLGRIYAPESAKQLEGVPAEKLARLLLDDERRLLAKDCRVLDTLLRRAPEMNAAGEVVGTLAMYVDITARKQVEEQLRQRSEQLRSLAQHQATVREEERKLIAREIHDELGQMLTALKMDVVWLGKRIPPELPQLAAKTESMSQMISTSIRSVQRISAELRPGLLDTLGLISAMEWQLQEFQERTALHCTLRREAPEDLVLESGLATALFRIFQEALTNIIRHARATTVHVMLTQEEHRLQLTVRDDGVGIDPAKLHDPQSIGLLGMRERLHPWQGEIEFQSVPGQGTAVCVTVPYRTPEQEVPA